MPGSKKRVQLKISYAGAGRLVNDDGLEQGKMVVWIPPENVELWHTENDPGKSRFSSDCGECRSGRAIRRVVYLDHSHDEQLTDSVFAQSGGKPA